MFTVLDNFLENPDGVRNSAIASGFGTWRPNKGEMGAAYYAGLNFYGDHATILKAIEKKVGFIGFPNSMLFRVTNETTERAVVHSDIAAGDTTCILYLSEHSDRYGTGFYRNKRTGSISQPSLEQLMKDPAEMALLKHEIDTSTNQWDEIEFVHGRYNRAIVFKSDRYHRRYPEHGFGTDEHTGRMIWIGHYRSNFR